MLKNVRKFMSQETLAGRSFGEYDPRPRTTLFPTVKAAAFTLRADSAAF